MTHVAARPSVFHITPQASPVPRAAAPSGAAAAMPNADLHAMPAAAMTREEVLALMQGAKGDARGAAPVETEPAALIAALHALEVAGKGWNEALTAAQNAWGDALEEDPAWIEAQRLCSPAAGSDAVGKYVETRPHERHAADPTEFRHPALPELDALIAGSPALLAQGQVVFHGALLPDPAPSFWRIEGYLSASFSPTVAIVHAHRKARLKGLPPSQRAVVLRITLTEAQPALVLDEAEFEVLLPRGCDLALDPGSELGGGSFRMMEARL